MTDYDQETGEIIEPQVPMLAPRMQPLASADVTEVCTALAKAQGEMEAPKRTKTAKTNAYSYTYAPLEEVIRVIQKPMAANGLMRQQYIVTRQGNWFVRTIIWHSSGQWLSSDYPVFADKMTQQGFQSGVTYAKRQGLCLVLGLAPEDDDDANVADGKVVQTEERRSVPRPAPVPAGNGAAKPTLASVTETPEKTRARELYNALVKDIGDASTEEELDTVASLGRCDEVDAAIQADGGHARAQQLMASIDSRVDARRKAIKQMRQGREDMGL